MAIVVRWADTARDRWTSALIVRDTTEGAKEPEVVAQAGADAPAWSPDGRWLAHLLREPGQPGVSLALWSAADRTVRPLARGLRAAGHPMWSPDGTRVAFVAAEDNGGEAPGRAPHVVRDLGYKIDGVGLVPKARRHLHTADIATGDVRQLTRGAFDVHGPAWSPDGAALSLGVSRPAGDVPWPLADVCLADAATGELRHLVDWGGTVVWTGWTRSVRSCSRGSATQAPVSIPACTASLTTRTENPSTSSPDSGGGWSPPHAAPHPPRSSSAPGTSCSAHGRPGAPGCTGPRREAAGRRPGSAATPPW
ncbi:hypothetical protein SAZ11_56565 [Streptomyces sp. FXJ1.4098]|nr:hypothetical protein [Streptomyces sp. FXJ1.4098]